MNNETKNTPAPWWIANQDAFNPITFVLARAEIGNLIVSQVYRIETEQQKDLTKVPDETNANAQLISAAPDLLAACEALLKMDTDPDFNSFDGSRESILRNAEAAINKARGGLELTTEED